MFVSWFQKRKLRQMVDRPNATPFSQDKETLTFKALLYSNVVVYAQVCRERFRG